MKLFSKDFLSFALLGIGAAMVLWPTSNVFTWSLFGILTIFCSFFLASLARTDDVGDIKFLEADRDCLQREFEELLIENEELHKVIADMRKRSKDLDKKIKDKKK